MAIIKKPDNSSATIRIQKIHMRSDRGKLSVCGLMWLDGEATDEPSDVTCERCKAIMKN